MLLIPFVVVFSATVVLFAEIPYMRSKWSHEMCFPKYLCAFFVVAAALTLGVPVIPQPIISYTQIPVFSLIRALIWIPFSLFVPGIFVLDMTGLVKRIRTHEVLVLAGSLSLSFLGLGALCVRALAPSMMIIIPIMTIAMGVAVSVRKPRKVCVQFTSEGILLAALIFSIITASATIQISQGYLVGGDLWRNTRISLYLSTRNDALTLFEKPETIGLYPTFVGYFIAALSSNSGLPATNAYVASFAIVGFLGVASYSVFNRLKDDKKIALLGTLFSSVGGGLGWVVAISMKLMPEASEFWTASYISQDMYFSQSINANLLQSTTALGLLLTLSALLAFLISFKTPKRPAILLSVLAGVLLTSSYLVHMVEFLLFVPIFIFFTAACRRSKEIVWVFFSFVISIGVFGLFNGFYEVRYGILRISQFLPAANTSLLLVGIFGCSIVVLFVSAIMRFRRSSASSSLITEESRSLLTRTKSAILIVYPFLCVLAWSLLAAQWAYSRLPDNLYALSVGYPLWIYPVTFGFIGLMSILGLRRLSLHGWTTWSIIGWICASFISASFVWGEKAAVLLLLPLSFLASIEITHWPISFAKSSSNNKKLESFLRRSFKSGIVFLLIVLVLVSSSASFVYTVRYFSRSSSVRVSDDVVNATRWIFSNLPSNATIFVPEWPLYDFVSTIGLRNTIPASEPAGNASESLDDTNTLLQDASPTLVASLLWKWKIDYALQTQESKPENRSYLGHLFTISKVLYASGTARVLQLPSVRSPEYYSDTVVIYPEDPELEHLFYLAGDCIVLSKRQFHANALWSDDSFGEGWNSSLEGSVIVSENNGTGVISAQAPTNDHHFFGVQKAIDANLSSSNCLIIRHKISNVSVYALSIDILHSSSHETMFLSRSDSFTTEIHLLGDNTMIGVTGIQLGIWTSSTQCYEWSVDYVILAKADL